MPVGIKYPEFVDYSKCEFCGKKPDTDWHLQTNEEGNLEKVRTLYSCRDDEGNYYCYCGACLERIMN